MLRMRYTVGRTEISHSVILHTCNMQEKVSTLHLACHHGDVKTVQILLEAGTEVDIRDQVCTFTPLYILVA